MVKGILTFFLMGLKEKYIFILTGVGLGNSSQSGNNPIGKPPPVNIKECYNLASVANVA